MTIIVSLIVSIAGWAAQTAPRSEPTVVFVCEHGAAKSVIAAAYFNKLAAERNLPFRAIFRGTTPQDDLSVRAVEGLKADGVAVPTGKPAAITDADIAAATHIFAIGCTLPDTARRSGKASDWSDVPGDQGYGPMRDAIVRHVQQLLDQLAAQRVASPWPTHSSTECAPGPPVSFLTRSIAASGAHLGGVAAPAGGGHIV